MSDMNLAARDEEAVETYSDLFSTLGSLIDREAFIGIMEMVRRGVFMSVTMDMWDEVLKLAERQQNPGLSYIRAAHAGGSFDGEAYAECVHAPEAIRLGQFLARWEEAVVTLGGQRLLNCVFRDLRGAELNRMVEHVYRSVEKTA